jgi:hypothetical protein
VFDEISLTQAIGRDAHLLSAHAPATARACGLLCLGALCSLVREGSDVKLIGLGISSKVGRLFLLEHIHMRDRSCVKTEEEAYWQIGALVQLRTEVKPAVVLLLTQETWNPAK